MCYLSEAILCDWYSKDTWTNSYSSQSVHTNVLFVKSHSLRIFTGRHMNWFIQDQFWHFWHVLHALHGLHSADWVKNLFAQFIWSICFIWALKIGLRTPLKWPKTSKTLKNSHFWHVWHVLHALHGLHSADQEKNVCAQLIWSISFIWDQKKQNPRPFVIPPPLLGHCGMGERWHPIHQ